MAVRSCTIRPIAGGFTTIAQNTLAALAVGLELGLAFDDVAAALAEFQGAER